MAKSKNAAKAKAWLSEVRDKPRFCESADEHFAAVKALEALAGGDVDAAMARALEIGRIQGASAMAEALDHLANGDGQRCNEVRWAAGGSKWPDELITIWRTLDSREKAKVRAMHNGKQQTDYPEDTQRAAVQRFDELLAEYKASGAGKPKSKATAKVCLDFSISKRSLSRWRKSFATR